MTLERYFRDGNGHVVRVQAVLDEDRLDTAIVALANAARSSASGRATALRGALTVTVIHDDKKDGK